MIGSKSSTDPGWNLLFAASLAGILAASWFIVIRPKQTVVSGADGPATVDSIHRTTKTFEDKAAPEKEKLEERTWDIGPEVFGSKSLDLITNLCGKDHLQLASFHISRTIPAAGLLEAPLVAVVEGGFMDVMNLVNDIEQPKYKLALSQIHVASNGGGDRVRATLNLTGFLHREAK